MWAKKNTNYIEITLSILESIEKELSHARHFNLKKTRKYQTTKIVVQTLNDNKF